MASHAPRRDRFDHPLSTSSTNAAATYVDGLDRLLAGGVDAELALAGAIAEDEGFAMAHALLAAADQRARRFDVAKAGAQRARDLTRGTTRRERQHVEVIAESILGSGARSRELAKEHLDEFPGDGYILQQLVFLMRGAGEPGYNQMVLDALESYEPAYGDEWFYTGTRSFYLHEVDRFEESRHFAEVSLRGNPRNGNASHNLAHCFYETADYTGGLAFLNDWIVDYDPRAPHFSHLNWHRALFELTQGRYERSYAIYQSSIRPSVLNRDMSGLGPPLADATSLFWRFRLYGHPFGADDAWKEIEGFASDISAGPRYSFFDAHAALAFAATGNDEAMARLIDAVRAAGERGDTVAREVTLPLVLGIEAFGRGAYEETVHQMEALGDNLGRVGGSQAQRQVFEDTLLQAYMLTERYTAAERMLRTRLEHRHTARDFFWLADTRASQGDAVSARDAAVEGQALWNAADANAPELRAIDRADR